MNEKEMIEIFEEYEKNFNVWLYSAWNFDSVDWIGLAEEAKRCIQNNSPMTEETKMRYFEQLENGKIY